MMSSGTNKNDIHSGMYLRDVDFQLHDDDNEELNDVLFLCFWP